jgi:hypothetical protein
MRFSDELSRTVRMQETCRGQRVRITSSGALTQMFGSKSRDGRGSLSLDARYSSEYRTSFPTWPCYLAGPFFLKREATHVPTALLLRRAHGLPIKGKMAHRIREFDWAATPLGPTEHWPQSLRTTLELMLPAGRKLPSSGARNASHFTMTCTRPRSETSTLKR